MIDGGIRENTPWKELKDNGYLIQYRLKDEETKQFYYEYEVCDNPYVENPPTAQTSTKPYVENPHVASPPVEFPHGSLPIQWENHSHNKTLSNNTINNNTLYTNIIHTNIDYDPVFVSSLNKELVDNIVDVMVDILINNYECIKREYNFDLAKSQKRLEIVEGLLKALEDIDNIIALIKASESSTAAVGNLINKYKFTELQAKAIVDMKLGRLAHLEKIELNEERKELTSTIETCKEVIGDIKRQQEIYLERFVAFIKKYPNCNILSLKG